MHMLGSDTIFSIFLYTLIYESESIKSFIEKKEQ